MHNNPQTTDQGHPTTTRPPHRKNRRRKAALRLLLLRDHPPGSSPTIGVIVTAATLAGAGLVASTAVIHLHLWLAGYRDVPRVGPLFLAQAMAGLVLAPILAVGRQLGLVIGAAIYMAASALGLILSATIGFLGIHDGLGVPWATPALVVELVGVVLLSAAGALLLLPAIKHSSSPNLGRTDIAPVGRPPIAPRRFRKGKATGQRPTSTGKRRAGDQRPA